MKRVLCYGDSNTWGFDPSGKGRFPEGVRWTSIVQEKLGQEYKIVEDGINGRTTCFDKGWGECKNGRTGLGFSLLAHYPLDCIVVMLGTNDIAEKDASYAASGVSEIIRLIKHANAYYRCDSIIFEKEPKILLVSPITLNRNVDDSPILSFRGKYAESLKFAELYKEVAKANNVEFLDAALYAKASVIDGIHMDKENHALLADAIAMKLKEILQR